MIKFSIYRNPQGLKYDHNFIKEVENLVAKSWGEFPKDYIYSSIICSELLCIARTEDALIGLAPVKKVRVFDDTIYSFGLTVVDPDFRDGSILKKMAIRLVSRIFLKEVIRGKYKLELIFITPNIRTLGLLSRVSSFVYPNPYLSNPDGSIREADEETWERTKEYLKVTGEKYNIIEREACVIEGFYKDKDHLAIKQKIVHHDKVLDRFGEKYLYKKPGREIVVRSIINIKDLVFGIFAK